MNAQHKKDLMARVAAEINAADVLQIAREVGMPVTLTEAAELLNDEARAKAMWKHMVAAAHDYIAATLEARRHRAWWEQAAGHEAEKEARFDA